MTKKTRQDERKTEKVARVWRKVLTFATDFENEINFYGHVDYNKIREPNTFRVFRTFWRLYVEKRPISQLVFITIMSAPYL